MSDLERDVARLADLLRTLEHEYELFFSGQLRTAPFKTEAALTAIVRTHGGRSFRNQTLRFRFSSIVARYNSMKKVWERRMREREEGRGIGRPQVLRSSRQPDRIVTSDPAGEEAKVETIFNSYRRLRRQCGMSAENLRLDSFRRTLDEKVKNLRASRGCESVEIRLVKDGNKCRILLRPTGDGSD